MNAINFISPYKHDGVWVFDDEARGLTKEPFVLGADTLIDYEVIDIENVETGFLLFFSEHAFPKYSLMLEWRRYEFGGNWYFSSKYDSEGWLCPALMRYFESAPRKIYIQVRPKNISL